MNIYVLSLNCENCYFSIFFIFFYCQPDNLQKEITNTLSHANNYTSPIQTRCQAVCVPTYLVGPAGSVLVVVDDSLQLAAPRKLPGDELEASPQTFTVEEDEELGHRSGEEKTGRVRC